MPEAPHSHLSLTMRTAQGGPPGALLISLPLGQPGNARHRARADAFHLGQGSVHHNLHLGARLGGGHPIIPHALAPFGYRVLAPPADQRGDSDGGALHPCGAVGPGMVCAPLAIRAIDAPDGAGGAHHHLRVLKHMNYDG
jgi:hypothetical protein